MIVLGIETSCDETAVALVADGRKILVNLIASQVEIHRPFGGVVPELASREHLRLLLPLLEESLAKTNLSPSKIDAVAVTRGPGLIGALLVGTSFAKALAYAWQIPLIGVHHLKAHLYASFMEGESPAFPLVGLVVSGGHTAIIHLSSREEGGILGQTRDDAAGEAFDKVASLLSLGYPGGPEIEKISRKGDPRRYDFPRGMLKSGDLDFSFSGLKTAVRYLLQKIPEDERGERSADIAASFQTAVVEVLLFKLKRASLLTGARTIVLGGGVARNQLLREEAHRIFSSPCYRLLIPSPGLCSDNAAMIAGLAFWNLRAARSGPVKMEADPNLPWHGGLG